MASEEPVQPLRLSKNDLISSPTKMASSIPRPLSEISPTEKRRNSPSWKQSTKHSNIPCVGRTRPNDSEPRADTLALQKAAHTDSSPFQSSPLDGTTSPRLFWQNRNLNSENSPFSSGRSGSPSPTRRPSVERLQKASRVKNSNILALEHKNDYDPARVPQIERPLAKVQGNAYGGTGIAGANKAGVAASARAEKRSLGQHRNESKTNLALDASRPMLPPPVAPQTQSPGSSKEHGSPIKSSLSLSRFKSSFDPETGAWSADESCDERELPEGKTLQRQAKSVTFDAAPPQVNEYEMATPDLSSIGSNSREGSYDSDEDGDEDDDDDDDEGGHYMLSGGIDEQDDSFDASLEDTDKTPVVGPDDWRQDSHDQYSSNASPMPEDVPAMPATRPQHQQHRRTDSSNSNNGDHRPLPPLPGAGLTRSNSTTSNGLSATAERMLGARRGLPSPPPATATKSEIQNIGNAKMTLEERLRLMMLSDDGKSAAEQQRERRMRRAGARDRNSSQTPERDGQSPSVRQSQSPGVYSPSASVQSPSTPTRPPRHQRDSDILVARQLEEDNNRRNSNSGAQATQAGEQDSKAQEAAHDEDDEEDDTIGDISGLGEYQLPPRISRESILRRVNGNIASLRDDSDYNFSSPPPMSSSPGRQLPYDPDVPLPSTEEDSILDDGSDDSDDEQDGRADDEEDYDDEYDEESSVIVKRDIDADEEPEIDLYSIPEMYKPGSSEGRDVDGEDEVDKDDGESLYSDVDLPKFPGQEAEEDQVSTPRAATPVADETVSADKAASATAFAGESLELAAQGGEGDFAKSFQSYMLPEKEELKAKLPEPLGEKAETKQTEEEAMATPTATTEAKKIETDVEVERPHTPVTQAPRVKKSTLSKPEYDGTGWGEPEEGEEGEDDEPGTPESVIHHPVSDYEEDAEAEEEEEDDGEGRESPVIPEQLATIKSASGSKLKTRPSATPSDLETMREVRRHVSREIPVVPPIPERHRDHRISRDLDAEIVKQSTSSSSLAVPSTEDDYMERHPSFKKRSLTLDLDLGLSLDQDFDRVIEAQKRGYLMRQNTKLVAASDKDADADDTRGGCRSAGGSPVKAARPKSWVVEPWNPQAARRRSIRTSIAPATHTKRPGTSAGLPGTGAVPPLPGQVSNAAAIGHGHGHGHEEEMAGDLMAPGEDGGERGRLFVKVMGVKDLDLPIPKNERTWFSLTLDNGVHCVKTAWLELARNAPIGQEFELVVPNDLEFQLTLNVKLEKPPVIAAAAASTTAGTISSRNKLPASPTKISRPKTSAFSRVFASPRKRKEMEQRQREEEERLAQQQREAAALQARLTHHHHQSSHHLGSTNAAHHHPSAWDLLSPLASTIDGSFARAYMCLKEHEARCFGRPYLVEVAAFNEWAAEEASFASSVKSKRAIAGGSVNGTGSTGSGSGASGSGAVSGPGGGNLVLRAPYKIGKLELQLLFVPRPRGATEDDMPKSMNSCIREMKAAEERLARNYEGHLSQQGGDCPFWRRRYFKLVGNKLTAYHEATRQPRATINLANAKRLIDDRQTLTERETMGKGGRRRRSAFAEEEEGYMFVEEGFRIRFNNGEVIDFYADNTSDKDGWMKVLAEVIGRDSLGGGNSSDDDSSSASSITGGRAGGGSGSSRAKGKWCELVLKREETLRRRAEGRRVHSRTKSMYM